MLTISVLENYTVDNCNFCLKILQRRIQCRPKFKNKCMRARLPEERKGFVVATSDERHLNALSPNLITVQTTDGTYGLS